jgi:hypothetical protein
MWTNETNNLLATIQQYGNPHLLITFTMNEFHPLIRKKLNISGKNINFSKYVFEYTEYFKFMVDTFINTILLG